MADCLGDCLDEIRVEMKVDGTAVSRVLKLAELTVVVKES